MNSRLFVALAAAAVWAQCAAAQSNPFPQAQGAVITRVSSNEIISFFQSARLTARFAGEEADGTKTVEVSSGGETVYVAMRGCDGQGPAARCEVVQPYGFFAASGVTYDQLNNFNLNVSASASAMLFPDGRGILASKIYLNGGVAFENVTYELAVYFADITRLLQSIKPGIIAEIDWRPDGAGLASGGIDYLRAAGGEPPHVNATGPAQIGLLTEGIRAILDGRRKVQE